MDCSLLVVLCVFLTPVCTEVVSASKVQFIVAGNFSNFIFFRHVTTSNYEPHFCDHHKWGLDGDVSSICSLI